MLIYNADETGVGIVTKPGKVFAEIGRRNVYTITAAESGKTHTVMSCVSASGSTLPPLMVYPRKRSVPDKMRAGVVGGTLFEVSDNGWINKEMFLVWLQHFVDSIPPVRPVLLILDGHSSHVTIEAIELPRSNDVHMLCLPSHTTHILQPLDVGVFKPFKAAFSKASHQFIMQNPGRVVTNDVLASLVGDAWPHAFTPLNIMAGIKKCGIYPFNPGEVLDRQVAPLKAATPPPPILNSPEVSVFSPEKQSLFQKRYEEGYDMNDPEYMVWLRINHSDEVNSASSSVSSASPTLSHQSKQSNGSSSHQSKQSNESLSTSHQSKQANESIPSSHQSKQSNESIPSSHQSKQSNESSSHQSKQSNESLSTSHQSKQSNGSSSHQSKQSNETSHQSKQSNESIPSSLDVISKMLLLPQPPERSKKGRKQAVNKTTVCITEEDILCNLKQKKADRLDKEAQKEKRKKDREIKQHERIMEKEEKRKIKEAKKKVRDETKSKKGTRKKNQPKA